MAKNAHFKVDPKLAELLGETYRSVEEAVKELIDNSYYYSKIIAYDTKHMTELKNYYQQLKSSKNDLEYQKRVIVSLKKEMNKAAKDLEFERAAELRDEIKALQKLIVLEA